MINESPEISIILPCKNEEKALGRCLTEIKRVTDRHNLKAEVIVSDSSEDLSPVIAKQYGVTLLKHDQDGYGRAFLEAFKVARGKYLFFADADGSYDFKEIPKFLKPLRNGHDFVIGDRFKGRICDGAMPWHHRYIGNPLLSFLLRVFHGTTINDVHCGMRAIKRQSLDRLNLRTTGMEFASEMIVKATKNKLNIKEYPIIYYPRLGRSKLKSFADGWRHLRFMFLYSPYVLFLSTLVLQILRIKQR